MSNPALFKVPGDAQFLTVELARVGGGSIKQRVTVFGTETLQDVITKGVRGCNRKRIKVANVLRVTHKEVLLFDYARDMAEVLR